MLCHLHGIGFHLRLLAVESLEIWKGSPLAGKSLGNFLRFFLYFMVLMSTDCGDEFGYDV